LATKLKKRIYSGVVHNEDEIFDKILIVASGKISVLVKDSKVGTLEVGQYFGDIALFIEYKSNYTYIVDNLLNTNIYELELYQIVEIIGPDYINIIIQSIFLGATFSATKLKNYLLGESIPLLLNNFRLEFYEKNRVVYSKNLKINKKICIIISGKLVKKTNISEIVAISEQLYGEEIIDSVEKYFFIIYC